MHQLLRSAPETPLGPHSPGAGRGARLVQRGAPNTLFQLPAAILLLQPDSLGTRAPLPPSPCAPGKRCGEEAQRGGAGVGVGGWKWGAWGGGGGMGLCLPPKAQQSPATCCGDSCPRCSRSPSGLSRGTGLPCPLEQGPPLVELGPHSGGCALSSPDKPAGPEPSPDSGRERDSSQSSVTELGAGLGHCLGPPRGSPLTSAGVRWP